MFKAFQLFVFIPVFLFLLPVMAKADLGPGIDKGSLTIPASRLYDWTKAGVQGGVPDTSNTTLWPVIDTDTTDIGGCTHFTAGEKSDSNSDKAKIECYINYATTQSGVGGRQGTVVKLGAGTFTIGNEQGVRLRNNVVLRGSGVALTRIYRSVTGSNYCAGTASGIDYGGLGLVCMTGNTDAIAYPLAVDLEKGATTVTFPSDPGGFAPSAYIYLRELDQDPVRIPLSVDPSVHIVQLSRLSASSPSSGTTRTLEKGSYGKFNISNRARAYKIIPLTNAGVENLHISRDVALTEAQIGWSDILSILYAANSWVSNVEMANGGHSLMNSAIATHITVQHSYFHNIAYTDEGGLYNSSGIYIGFGTTDSLYANNRISDTEDTITLAGHASRNVLAYNYSFNLKAPSRDCRSHGEYPEENLCEGNSGGADIHGYSDDWWGGAFATTYFRNRYVGIGNNAGMQHSSDDRGPWAYKYENQLLNVYRNMKTIPGGDFNFDGGWQGVAGDNLWAEKNRFTNIFVQSGHNGAVLPSTTYVDDSAACLTNASYCRGAVGPTIRTSTGVLSTGYDGTTVPTSWASMTFPASLFLTVKPSWWCDETPWPGIGADHDVVASLDKTPAQRVAEGLPCTTSGGTVITPPTNNPPTVSLSVTPTSITTGGSVTFSATASDSDGTISNVQFYVNNNYQVTDTTFPFSLSYSPTTAGSYAITAIATDNGGATGPSNSVTVTVTAPNNCGNSVIDSGEACDGTNLNNQTCSTQGFTGGTLSCSSSCTFNTASCTSNTGSCTTSTTAWQNIPFTSQSTPFTAEFDVTPTQAGLDAITALSTSASTAYASFPILIRFGGLSLQYIEARNGTVYGATNPMTYTIGSTHHFRVVINPTSNLTPVAKSYSVYVRPPGGTEQLLASNFAFRDGQTNTSSFANLGIISDPLGHRVCNFTVTSGTPPANALSNLSFSFTTDTNLSLSGKTLTVSILPQGSTKTTPALETQSPTASYLNGLNQVTLPTTGRTPGSYDVQIKAPGTLSRKQTFTLASNQTFTLTNKLISGDLNADNAINALDWSMMSSDWFLTNRTSDINGDGITNALDFTWLNRNWFLIGE